MLPLILGVLGGYLIGDSIKDDAISMAKGGKVSDVYIFDIYLYSYNDEGSIDVVKEKRKM